MRKSFPLSFRCVVQLGVAISIYHPNPLNWLNWPRWVFTPMLSDYWAELHWVAIPSQRAMSQLLSFSPPRRLQHWAADAVAYSTAAPLKHSFFCTAALFCVLTLFFAQPITFLHFYQRTSISEIWLHLLLLPQQHCVSSLNQRAPTAAAAAAGGGEVTDNAHLSPSKIYVTFPDWFTEYLTYKASASYVPIRMFTIHRWSELVSSTHHYPLHTWMIMTSSSLFHLILFPHPGQLFMKAEQSKGLTLKSR